MLNPKHLLFYVIKPTLQQLGLGGAQAEMLVLGTALTESGLTAIVQDGGPALGLWQIEPTTEKDIWDNYLAFRSDLKAKVMGLVGSYPSERVSSLIGNLYYGAAICRIRYHRAPAQLPKMTLSDMAAYWKEWYNTPLGKGTPEEFIERAAVIVQPEIWSV